MATVVTKTLYLVFNRQDGDTHTMTISDYKEDVTDVEINAAAAIIVAQNIFEPDGYPLTALRNAYTRDTTETDVVNPPTA